MTIEVTRDVATALCYFNGSTTTEGVAYVQLELGSTATEYEPYVSRSTPIDLKGNVLSSLPDGTRDVLTVDANGGRSIESNTITLVETSSSGWNLDPSNTRFYKSVDTAVSDTTNGVTSYCDTLPLLKSGGTIGNTTGYTSVGGAVYVRIYGVGTLDALNTWFASNPTTFILKQQSPQTVELDNIDPISMPINGNLWATSNIECEVEQGSWSKTPLEQTDALPYLWSRLTFDMDDDPDIQAYIVSKAGSKGDKGDPGAKGDPGNPGPGVAAGGTTGQMLVKKSDANYDTEWSKVADITDFTDPKTRSRLGKNAQQYVVPFSTTGQLSVSAWQWTEVNVEALWPADRIVDIYPMNYLSYDVLPFEGSVIDDPTASVYIMPFRASFYAGKFLGGEALIMSTVDINTTESSTGISFSGLIR